MDGIAEVVELLVSDLVTNAVLHAGTPVTLRLLWDSPSCASRSATARPRRREGATTTPTPRPAAGWSSSTSSPTTDTERVPERLLEFAAAARPVRQVQRPGDGRGEAATARGEAEMDVVYRISVSAGAAAVVLGEMWEATDEFCRQGHLLALETPPELVCSAAGPRSIRHPGGGRRPGAVARVRRSTHELSGTVVGGTLQSPAVASSASSWRGQLCSFRTRPARCAVGGEVHAMVIAGAGLFMRFGGTVALRDVDVVVSAGEAVSVVGRSGSGKSTLLHCLAGLVVPTAGTVTAGGVRLSDLDAEALARHRRRSFGFVFQSGLLLADLPAVENVALPLLLDGVDRRVAVERARGALAEFDIADLADRLPGAVSGGEAQRIAVARALVADPEVVFADEPTGALDSENADQVADALFNAVRQRHGALLLVTHDHQLAARADRIVVLSDGAVIDGPAAA